jgi:hypothetical protein
VAAEEQGEEEAGVRRTGLSYRLRFLLGFDSCGHINMGNNTTAFPFTFHTDVVMYSL